MSLNTSTVVGLPRPRPKMSVYLAWGVSPFLMALACYEFWVFFNAPAHAHLFNSSELISFFLFAILPILITMLFSVMAAQRFEYERLSVSYQSRIDGLQKRINSQEDFLHSITDHNPESLTIFDRDNNYWFVNANAAKQVGLEPNDIVGKTLIRVLGHERSKKLQLRLDAVRTKAQAIEALDQVVGSDGKVQFIKGHYQIIDPFGDFVGGIMVREENVTGFIIERERRENMLRQVIATLVAVVDRRDPYAAGHSKRVGQLSRSIAEELVLTEIEIETSEIAGSLMNFGKVLVSREILTKTTALSTDELQRVRDSILTSADILSIIDFVGPVVPTLRQVMERFDGTGVPSGLKGSQILITARIVAVANAYVALVSARAHRPGLDYRDAVQRMMKDADTVYDRAVVVGLANCIENRAHKLEWLGAALHMS